MFLWRASASTKLQKQAEFAVCGKMGYSSGLYDLVASALGLPTSRTLREYTIPTSNDPDGMLFANILRAADEFDKLNPRAGLYDWRRHCSLGFDSMTCKGSFVVNYHTTDVIGLGADCLKLNVILNELKELESQEKNDSQLERESELTTIVVGTDGSAISSNTAKSPPSARRDLKRASDRWNKHTCLPDPSAIRLACFLAWPPRKPTM